MILQVITTPIFNINIQINHLKTKFHILNTFPTYKYISLQNNIHVSKVHCGSAIRFGQALPGYLITAHRLCVFLLYLARYLCGGFQQGKKKSQNNSEIIS